MAENLTEAEFEKWKLASVVINEATTAFDSKELAAKALVHRLSARRLRAAAESVLKSKANFPGDREKTYVLVPKEHWEYIAPHPSKSLLWTSDDVELWADKNTRRYKYCGVRFDPVGLAAMPALSANDSAAPATTPVAAPPIYTPPLPVPQATDRRKPVTAPALKFWAEAFAKIHRGEDVAQPLAIKSAEGMFPDKSVSRDRITAALKAAGVTFRRGPRRQITGE